MRVIHVVGGKVFGLENPIWWETIVCQDVTQEGRDVTGLVAVRGCRAGASVTAVGAAGSTRRGLRRAAALTAKGARAVADSISIAHNTVSIGGRRAVTGVLKADLQHFLKREGIAFIDERHKVAVGALMVRRRRKMKSHESGTFLPDKKDENVF